MKKQGNGTMTRSEESIMLMTAYSLSTIARAHPVSIMTSAGERASMVSNAFSRSASYRAQEKESVLPLFVGGKKYFINPLILVMSIHIGINTALHDFHNLVIESRVKNQ